MSTNRQRPAFPFALGLMIALLVLTLLTLWTFLYVVPDIPKNPNRPDFRRLQNHLAPVMLIVSVVSGLFASTVAYVCACLAEED